MSIADKLGFGPKRTILRNPDNAGWVVVITPPEFINPSRTSVRVSLSDDQFRRYGDWLNGKLIQEAMPDLSPSDREKLMTGLEN